MTPSDLGNIHMKYSLEYLCTLGIAAWSAINVDVIKDLVYKVFFGSAITRSLTNQN